MPKKNWRNRPKPLLANFHDEEPVLLPDVAAYVKLSTDTIRRLYADHVIHLSARRDALPAGKVRKIARGEQP